MNPLLVEGLSDAVGFVGGAMLGFWVGRWLGLDLFAPGYGHGTIAGILLTGVGGGSGLQLARRWRIGRNTKKN
jgi:hypothetical protein